MRALQLDKLNLVPRIGNESLVRTVHNKSSPSLLHPPSLSRDGGRQGTEKRWRIRRKSMQRKLYRFPLLGGREYCPSRGGTASRKTVCRPREVGSGSGRNKPEPISDLEWSDSITSSTVMRKIKRHTHQGVGQISARVLDILDPGESADLTEEHGRREVKFVGRRHR